MFIRVLGTTTMRQIIFILIISLVGISCIPSGKNEYSIGKDKIEHYRKKPVTNKVLIEIIKNNEEFINLDRNPAISEATLEHHLISEHANNGFTTYIVFEYFSLEGETCNIKAVTIDANNKLLSILRLANYEDYPDGYLKESTIVEDDFAKRTTIVQGLHEYNDSLNQFIMKIDCTVVKFKWNQFKQIEVVDSIFKHHEYIE